MQELRAQLAETLDEAELEWLKPHIQRDVVVVVHPQLDLLDVGIAIARDDALSVQHWISEQLIHKPSPNQLADWNTDQTKRFQALIVQPYVLVQESVTKGRD
ncbi:DUF2288 family protein [Microcoleus sp. FACHB-53]|jgi:hypothetical protein|nr:DUF2288 family protein [Microcoleus sp. FACHB-53]MBD2128180.1 DUF2288 family protein [Microcoleus sp. FACHB-1]